MDVASSEVGSVDGRLSALVEGCCVAAGVGFVPEDSGESLRDSDVVFSSSSGIKESSVGLSRSTDGEDGVEDSPFGRLSTMV